MVNTLSFRLVVKFTSSATRYDAARPWMFPPPVMRIALN